MKLVRSIWRTIMPFALVALDVIAWLSLAVTVGAQVTPDSAPARGAALVKAVKNPAASEFKPVLETQSMDMLKALSAKLVASKSMSITAAVSYDYPCKLGPPITDALGW